MSCFMHSPEVYDAIYTYLKNRDFDHVWLNICMPAPVFVKSLVDYNIKAMLQRYGEKVREEVEWMKDYTPRLVSGILSDMQAFKFLQSIDYQCIDSDDYCSEFSSKFRDVSLAIAETIIRKMPSYETAVWS